VSLRLVREDGGGLHGENLSLSPELRASERLTFGEQSAGERFLAYAYLRGAMDERKIPMQHRSFGDASSEERRAPKNSGVKAPEPS